MAVFNSMETHGYEDVYKRQPVIVDGELKGSVAVIRDVSEIMQLTDELERIKSIVRGFEPKYSFEDEMCIRDSNRGDSQKSGRDDYRAFLCLSLIHI